jgi:hypothetical protein
MKQLDIIFTIRPIVFISSISSRELIILTSTSSQASMEILPFLQGELRPRPELLGFAFHLAACGQYIAPARSAHRLAQPVLNRHSPEAISDLSVSIEAEFP